MKQRNGKGGASAASKPSVKTDWLAANGKGKAPEQQVARMERAFLEAMGSVHEAIFLTDGEDRVRFWNTGAEMLFGYSRAEAEGLSMLLLVPEESRGKLGKRLGESRHGRRKQAEPRVLDTLGLRKDGTRFPMEISLESRPTDGKPLRFVLVRETPEGKPDWEAIKEGEERHRLTEEALQYRIRFENLITSISTHFINLSTDWMDSGIHYALNLLGDFVKVDRSYIFLFGPDGQTVDNTHEWCAPGIKSQRSGLQALPVSRYPWFMDRINALQAVHVPRVSALPAAALAERQEFEREGIQSLIVVPMVYRGSPKGYLGFDSVRSEKRWPDEVIDLLRVVGEIFINALERKKIDQALREAKSRYLSIFENAVEGIFQTSPRGDFLNVNPAFIRIFGYDDINEMVASLSERGFSWYLDPGRRREFLRILRERGEVMEFESQAMRKDGSVIWISENARAVRKSDGSLDYCEGTLMDVTQRKRMEEQLVHGALHDSLTGLANRALLMERLGRTLDRNRRRPDDLSAVLILDLDRFKLVNDSMGHLRGDNLLVAIARRLESFLPPGTTLARLGGDEFCILLEDMRDSLPATLLADRILAELTVPFDLDGEEVFAAGSLGIAIATPHYGGPEEVLRDADTAMHRAKLAGKGRYEVFDASMHARAVHMLALETDLRKALGRGEFRLHYQPIVSLADSSLTGFEALIRWQHPRLGLVPPGDFIPMAEDTGLIIPMGLWVLREACFQLAEWQRLGPAGTRLSMSVNISGKQLADLEFVRQIEGILAESGLQARHLKLEVTESAIMENPERATAILTKLRDLGVLLSLDDFGTGYSSLSYLHRFPFQNLKIDRSFVAKMESGNKDTEIVRVITALARNLGMDVVAEGIETDGQWALLHGLACGYGQGFYFSRPMENGAALKLIEMGGFLPRAPGEAPA